MEGKSAGSNPIVCLEKVGEMKKIDNIALFLLPRSSKSQGRTVALSFECFWVCR